MSIYNLKGLYVIFKLKVIHKAYYVYYVGGTVMFFAATVFMHGIHGFHKLVPTPLCF